MGNTFKTLNLSFCNHGSNTPDKKMLWWGFHRAYSLLMHPKQNNYNCGNSKCLILYSNHSAANNWLFSGSIPPLEAMPINVIHIFSVCTSSRKSQGFGWSKLSCLSSILFLKAAVWYYPVHGVLIHGVFIHPHRNHWAVQPNFSNLSALSFLSRGHCWGWCSTCSSQMFVYNLSRAQAADGNNYAWHCP